MYEITYSKNPKEKVNFQYSNVDEHYTVNTLFTFSYKNKNILQQLLLAIHIS